MEGRKYRLASILLLCLDTPTLIISTERLDSGKRNIFSSISKKKTLDTYVSHCILSEILLHVQLVANLMKWSVILPLVS